MGQLGYHRAQKKVRKRWMFAGEKKCIAALCASVVQEGMELAVIVVSVIERVDWMLLTISMVLGRSAWSSSSMAVLVLEMAVL